MGKGSYPGAGPYNVPAVRIVARLDPVAHGPVDGLPRLRQPAGQLGGRVDARRGAPARSGIDRLELRLRNLAARGDRFIPFDTPCDGDWAQAVRLAAERDRAGASRSPRVAAGGSRSASSPARRPGSQLRHRPAARRRLRGRLRRHVGHGAGRADGARPGRRARARARRSSGSPSSWATRRSCPTTSRRRPRGRPSSWATRCSPPAGRSRGKLRGDGGAAPRRGRGGRSSSTDGVVRLPDGSELAPIEVLKPGLGRLGGELTGVGETRKDAEPDHPLGGAPAFFEFNCTVDRGVTSTRRRAT